MLVFDGHLDLAMNALAYGRDLALPLDALRRREAAFRDDGNRGTATVSLEELRRGRVFACAATLFARAARTAAPTQMLRRSDSDFASTALAHAAAHGQLAWYRWLERHGHLRMISSAPALAEHAATWRDPAVPAPPLGAIVLMEGADAVTSLDELRLWHEAGVRVMSLTHTEANAWAGGNNTTDRLTAAGIELLGAMDEAGMILDLSHLADAGFFAALDAFPGRVLASHSNCRSLAPGARQISDEQIRLIAGRGGVIGVALHTGMLSGGRPARSEVSFEQVALHIDHICQLTGSADHAAIGSDLDGGFGREQTPVELDTAADLHAIAPHLTARGYTADDLNAILSGNWLRFYVEALPQA